MTLLFLMDTDSYLTASGADLGNTVWVGAVPRIELS